MNKHFLILIIILICTKSTTLYCFFHRTLIQQFTNKSHIPLLVGRLYTQLYNITLPTTHISFENPSQSQDFLARKIKVKNDLIFFTNDCYIQEKSPGLYQLYYNKKKYNIIIDPCNQKTILLQKIKLHPNDIREVITVEGESYFINKYGKISYD